MVHIQKKQSQELSNLLRVAQKDSQWVNATDKHGLRTAFDDLAPKEPLRTVLFREQKGLCAYCMRLLETDEPTGRFRLEHRKPLSLCKAEGLDYQNLFAVCNGGQTSPQKHGSVFCCDVAKADKEITFNPCDNRHIQQISYTKKGEIVSGQAEFQKEIDYVLCLNGKLDKQGTRVSDTNTRLVEGRRDTYHACEKAFISLAKKKQLNSLTLEKMISKLEQQELSEQYVGVTLYFLKKKLRSLVAQNK